MANAAENFSLKPFKPPLMNRLSRLLGRAQRSRVLNRIDACMKVADIYELLAGTLSPTITVLPPVQNKKPGNRDSAEITALSANLILFPAPFFFNQQQRIAEFARCAHRLNPDFIFLQEVWDNNSLSMLIASFPDYYSAYMPGLGYNYSGLLILSRYPTKAVMARRFAVSLKHSIEELTAQKGWLLVESEVNGKTVHLLNTHLYSADPRSHYRPNLDQFSQVAATATNLPGRVIVGGDMNLRPEDVDARLPGNLLRDACNLPTAGYPTLSKKLDYILLKTDPTNKDLIKGQRVETPIRFSDHIPVFAEIIFCD
ncbi:MAG: hypothetical protein A2W80_04805 [Candidatus Riflebacteria bacterium GWC2_50_8]|nr:MAG: hypothetical protein A2W80_04805 [Candidatus Riflebacteria bacterium GWC2_50_8]